MRLNYINQLLTCMTTIQQGGDVFTLINVFTVTPEQQQPLIDVLADAGEHAMKQVPGFMSSNLHKSHDGRYVVNYVQWRSEADFEAMKHNPVAIPHMRASAELADSYNPILCDVVASINA